jgi:FMN reductase
MGLSTEGPVVDVQTPVTVVIGNPKQRSRTYDVAVYATSELRARLTDAGVASGVPVVIDLSDRIVDLVSPDGRMQMRSLHDLMRRPGGLLVVASPTFKAAYTGLLKLFLDPLPRSALHGVVAVPVMTAASAHHQGVVETHLRPLLAESGARVPVPGLCVLEADFVNVDRVLGSWLPRVVPVLVSALRETAAHASPSAPRPPSDGVPRDGDPHLSSAGRWL